MQLDFFQDSWKRDQHSAISCGDVHAFYQIHVIITGNRFMILIESYFEALTRSSFLRYERNVQKYVDIQIGSRS